jgi:uncharacterized protein (DUF58 family)
MIPDDQFKKIQKLHFKTRYMAKNLFGGRYESAFKGHGLEFAEVREYQIGDDIRTIDWNVSARFGHPFVKIFHEERQHTVILLLDMSGSHLFGTRTKFKRDLLAEVAGMLAFLAIRTHDKVGAILFSSEVEKYIPPKRGGSHVWRLIREIFTYEPRNPGTNIDDALTFLNRVVKRHALVFLISDCMDSGFEKSVGLTASKYDLTVIRLFDPSERKIPRVGAMQVKDPETGEVGMIDTRHKGLRKRWREFQLRQSEILSGVMKKNGVDMVDLSTDGSVVQSLSQLFERRKRRF